MHELSNDDALRVLELLKTLPKQGLLQIMIHVFLVKMKTALPSRLYDTILFIIEAHANRSIETRQAMAYLQTVLKPYPHLDYTKLNKCYALINSEYLNLAELPSALPF